jgi:hypothetical protein
LKRFHTFPHPGKGKRPKDLNVIRGKRCRMKPVLMLLPGTSNAMCGVERKVFSLTRISFPGIIGRNVCETFTI